MTEQHDDDSMQWVKAGWRETWGQRIPATAEEWVDYYVRRSLFITSGTLDASDLKYDATLSTWTCAYLWEIVRRYAPRTVAAVAADDINLACEAGDSFGEWSHEWAEDLRAGRPINLPLFDRRPAEDAR